MHIKTLTVLTIAALVGIGCGQSGNAPAGGAGSSGSGTNVQTSSNNTAAAMPVVKTASGLEMVQLPGGKFKMGSENGDANQKPVHEVTIKPFLIDKTEVPQAVFLKIFGPAKTHFKGDNLPIEQVPWASAVRFCNSRSKAEGLTPCYNEDTGECNFEANGYRLPTEAEWEYAARAGNDADWCFGGDQRKLGDYGWFKDNSENKTHDVAQKKANAWGIYDMYGNVAEWTNDIYDENYYKNSPADSPHGGVDKDGNPKFTIRGGAYRFEGNTASSTWRRGEFPGEVDGCVDGDYLGFRCVRNAESKAAAPAKAEEPKKAS